MGFLQNLGLGDLADSFNELTTEVEGLKDEIIGSVVGPAEELSNTVGDITTSLSDEAISIIDSVKGEN